MRSSLENLGFPIFLSKRKKILKAILLSCIRNFSNSIMESSNTEKEKCHVDCFLEELNDEERNTSENATFEKFLDDLDTAIETLTEQNQIRESNSTDSKTPVIQLVSLTPELTDPEEIIVSNEDVDNTQNENLNKNSIEHAERYSVQAYEQCNDQEENMNLKYSAQLDSDEDLINPSHDSDILKVNNTFELSNATGCRTLLKSQVEESSDSHLNTSTNLEDLSNGNCQDKNNYVEKPLCNLAMHCELEKEINKDNQTLSSSVFLNSDSSSFAESCNLKLDFKADYLSLVKPCSIAMQRCDSLIKDYSTNMKQTRSLLSPQIDLLSKVNIDKVNKSISKDLKFKKTWKKKNYKCDSDTDDDEALHKDFDLYASKRNVTREKTDKAIRKKRRSDSYATDSSLESLETVLMNCSTNSKGSNEDSDQQLNKNDSSKSYAYSNSKENFQMPEGTKTVNIVETYSFCNEQTSENIESRVHKLSNLESKMHKKSKSLFHLEKNKTNYTDKEYCRRNEVSDVDTSDLFSNISKQKQLDDVLDIKPCWVVLTRYEYNNEKCVSVPSSSYSQNNSCGFSDFGEPSGLKREIEVSKPFKSRKQLILGQSDSEDLDSGNKYSKNSNVWKKKKGVKTSKLRTMSSNCEDLEHKFPKKRNRRGVKRRISNSTRSSSDINKVLELCNHELIQEVKELQTIMKRTERKIDHLIKLNEQVLNSKE